MGFSKGIYVLRAKGRVLTYSRVSTTAGADAYVTALTGQIGGKVVFRAEAGRVGDPGRVPEPQGGVVVRRAGKSLVVATSASTVGFPLGLDTLRAIGVSARGGVTLRPPAAKGAATKPIALVPYRTPDGGATASVPPGGRSTAATATSRLGRRRCVRARPLVHDHAAERRPGPLPATAVVAPYIKRHDRAAERRPADLQGRERPDPLAAARRAAADVHLVGALPVRLTVNGQAWTGIALVGTDSPDKYANLGWGLYYSGIGVRVGSSPALGLGLVDVEELEPVRRDRGTHPVADPAAEGDRGHVAAGLGVPLGHGRPPGARRRLPAAGLRDRGQLAEVRPAPLQCRPGCPPKERDK